MSQPLKIIFMGTPDFAGTALKALSDTNHQIVAVYSQPPRPKGRGQQTQLSPVHAYAAEQNLPVFTPVNFKDPQDRETFKSHNADLAIVAAYGLILPQEILDAPKFGCINIHASLLPRWRGASPIQHAIWKGDDQSGIALMQMEAGLDTGPVLTMQSLPVTQQTTATSLHDDLAALGADMIVKLVDDITQKGLPLSTPQDNAISTYAPMLKKQDGIIDWNQTANEIDRQIRALNPWPGVWTSCKSARIKILEAVPVQQSTNAAAGTLVDKTGLVVCGENTLIQIRTIQPEGKKPMNIASALNGKYLTIGEQFS
jgi:methionyl-tRNA formyltransferase